MSSQRARGILFLLLCCSWENILHGGHPIATSGSPLLIHCNNADLSSHKSAFHPCNKSRLKLKRGPPRDSKHGPTRRRMKNSRSQLSPARRRGYPWGAGIMTSCSASESSEMVTKALLSSSGRGRLVLAEAAEAESELTSSTRSSSMLQQRPAESDAGNGLSKNGYMTGPRPHGRTQPTQHRSGPDSQPRNETKMMQVRPGS